MNSSFPRFKDVDLNPIFTTFFIIIIAFIYLFLQSRTSSESWRIIGIFTPIHHFVILELAVHEKIRVECKVIRSKSNNPLAFFCTEFFRAPNSKITNSKFKHLEWNFELISLFHTNNKTDFCWSQ